jgi:hypothetical protein
VIGGDHDDRLPIEPLLPQGGQEPARRLVGVAELGVVEVDEGRDIVGGIAFRKISGPIVRRRAARSS